MVIAVQPDEYAMDPHTTNVPAETKPMNSDKLLIHQGTEPPAAKNDRISPADFLENDKPMNKMRREKSTITM
jgi:hypothetical protein